MSSHVSNLVRLMVTSTVAAACVWVSCGPVRADGMVGLAHEDVSLVGSLIHVTADDVAAVDGQRSAAAVASSAGPDFGDDHDVVAPASVRTALGRSGLRKQTDAMRVDLFPLSRVAVPLLVGGPADESGAESRSSIRPLVGPVVGVRSGSFASGMAGSVR